MKIDAQEIKQMAKKFLSVLDREGIQTNEDLEEKLGKNFTLENSQDFISIVSRPSNCETIAYTISYTRPGTGIPIELEINEQLNYSQIILKAQEKLEGYSHFHSDQFNNLVQNKVIGSSNFSLVREGLSDLV